MILAQVKDSAPQQTAPNEIVYADALDNISAAFRYTYRKNGISQDLVLLEAPPDPELLGLSAESRLEVYTEWTDDVPEPQRTATPIRIENDPTARAAKVEPDFPDEMLQFGADTRLIPGRAFSLADENAALDEIRVGKQFVRVDGRPVLIESVEFRALKPLFKDLRQAALTHAPKDSFQIASTRSEALALAWAAQPVEQGSTRIALARLELPPSSVVIDYTILNSSYSTLTLFTYNPSPSYYASGPVDITSSLTIQQGAIVKFALNANLRLLGALTCPGTGQAKAILTSKDDNLYGEVITGSTGIPTYMAAPAIAPYFTSGGLTIQNLRIRWAKKGVEAAGSTAVTHTVRDSLFEQCQTGVKNNMSAGSISLFGTTVKQCGVDSATPPPGITGSMEINCGVVNASKKSGHQAEPAIAVNPLNTAQIVIVSMHPNSSPLKLLQMSSTDGGVTWTEKQLPVNTEVKPPHPDADPDLVWDPWGNLFLTYAADDGVRTLKIYVSEDAGGTWFQVPNLPSTTVEATPKLAAGPKISGKSSLWVCYNKSQSPAGIYAAGVEVRGKGNFDANIGPTWVGPTSTPIPNSSSSVFSSIAIGPAGEVAITHIPKLPRNPGPIPPPTPPDTTTPVYLAVNTSGLAQHNFQNQPSAFFSILLLDEGFPVNGTLEIAPIPTLDWDRARDRLYMVYPNRPSSTIDADTDIYVRCSTTKGASWAAGFPVKINSGVSGRTEFHPRLSVNQADGKVGVIWYDCRNDSANAKPHLFAAVSTDQFASQPRNFQLNPVWSNVNVQPTYSFKEYIGLRTIGGFLYPAWLDNSNSAGGAPSPTTEFEIYTARIPF